MSSIKMTPREASEKWARRTKAATQDMRAGVEKVTEAPGKKAAAQQMLMMENLIRSIEDGTWARNVSAVSLEEWKTKMLEKGVGRVAAGVDGAADKHAEMTERLFVAIDKALAEVNKVPRGSFEQNVERMVKFATHMHKNPIK